MASSFSARVSDPVATAPGSDSRPAADVTQTDSLRYAVGWDGGGGGAAGGALRLGARSV